MSQRLTSTTSYSRLDLYNICPRKYWHKYIEKTEAPVILEEALLKGSLTHLLIEHKLIYNLESIDEILEILIDTWLEKLGIPITHEVCIQQVGEGIHIASLVEYAEKVSDLLIRTTEKYQGADSIRNGDGSIPKNVFAYPPKSWKVAYKELGTEIDSIRYAVDIAASRIKSDFNNMSLSKIVTEAVFLAKNFSLPIWFSKTIAVEYRFEEQVNSIYIDEDEDLSWTGGIDWICESQEGATIIIDHKSSKKIPEALDVIWHPQLNLYVELYKQQTGKLVDYIGINHLYSGNIVIAEVDIAIVADTINYYENLQKEIDKSIFTRRLPTAYNSPCIKRDYNSNKIGYICPYIKSCWSNFYQDIEQEFLCS